MKGEDRERYSSKHRLALVNLDDKRLDLQASQAHVHILESLLVRVDAALLTNTHEPEVLKRSSNTVSSV